MLHYSKYICTYEHMDKIEYIYIFFSLSNAIYCVVCQFLLNLHIRIHVHDGNILVSVSQQEIYERSFRSFVLFVRSRITSAIYNGNTMNLNQSNEYFTHLRLIHLYLSISIPFVLSSVCDRTKQTQK